MFVDVKTIIRRKRTAKHAYNLFYSIIIICSFVVFLSTACPSSTLLASECTDDGGAEALNACWFAANSNETCTNRCARNENLTSVDQETTCSAGTPENCMTVLDTLNLGTQGGSCSDSGQWSSGALLSMAIRVYTPTGRCSVDNTTASYKLACACQYPPPVTWKTDATSTDWGTGSNWDNGTGPTSTSDVIIPDATNAPVLNGTTSINSLIVQTNGTLTISGAYTLSVVGNLEIQDGGVIRIENASAVLDVTGTYNKVDTGAINATNGGKAVIHGNILKAGTTRLTIENSGAVEIDSSISLP